MTTSARPHSVTMRLARAAICGSSQPVMYAGDEGALGEHRIRRRVVMRPGKVEFFGQHGLKVCARVAHQRSLDGVLEGAGGQLQRRPLGQVIPAREREPETAEEGTHEPSLT